MSHDNDCNVWAGVQQCMTPDLTRICTCGQYNPGDPGDENDYLGGALGGRIPTIYPPEVLCDDCAREQEIFLSGCPSLPEPEPSLDDYIVTATVQILVKAEDETDARIQVAEGLDEFIEHNSAHVNDPMNGRVIESSHYVG